MMTFSFMPATSFIQPRCARVLVTTGVVSLLLGGCSWLPGYANRHDVTLDYLYAKEQPLLTMSSTEMQQRILPDDAMAVPAVSVALLPPESVHKAFEPPRPKPLAEDKLVAEPEARSTTSVVEQARMVYDGNALPVLNIASAFDVAWDRVQLALKKTEYHISDMNRSAGVFYLQQGSGKKKSKETVQLKLNRNQGTVIASVQVDEDQPAERGQAEPLLVQLRDRLEQEAGAGK